MSAQAAVKPIAKLLTANTGAHRMYEVFDNFVTMFALAFRNRVDQVGFQEREEEYLRIARTYEPEQLDRFAEAFAHVVEVMTVEPTDVLGRLYMELEISDASMGQFYTPYDIAVLMAQMNLPTLIEGLKEREFVTVYEPACGAGAMMIAITQALHGAGIAYQQRIHITGEDLSRTAVHMFYLHMSLLHVPAIVHRRNTLTMETFDTWRTPAHVLGGWDWRLRRDDAAREARAAISEPAETVAPIVLSSWDDVFAGVGA